MVKKITALLLAVLMLILQTAVIFAEEKSEGETVDSTFTENVEMLTSLGIYSGKGSDPNSTVTRAQFAENVVELFGWNSIQFDNSAPLPFVDVKSNSKSLNSIKIMIALGLMSGVNAVEFRPDDCVTYVQAVKVLVSALGYAPIAEKKGGWSGGYMSVGRELKLLLNGIAANEPVSNEMLVSLFVNAAKAEALELKALGDKVVYSKDRDRTLLSVYHDIYKSEGVVSDNGISALAGASGVGKGYVLIGGGKYSNEYMPLRELLGYSVEYYYRDAAGTQTVLYARPDNRTETLVIEADDLEVNHAGWSKTAIVYEERNSSRTASVSTYADFIYNGAADPEFTSDDFKIRNGRLTLVDTDKDGVYDIVMAEEYIDVFVSGVSVAQEMIYSQYANAVVYGDYKTYSFIDESGAAIEPKFIAAGNVLSVYASRNKECVKMMLGSEKAELAVERLEEENNSITLTSGEKNYKISVSLYDAMKSGKSLLKKPELGTRYQAYFNYKGEIAMLEEMTPVYEYAYALGAQKGKGLSSDKGQMKVYLSSNDCVIVDTADKILINGVSQKGADIISVADLYDGGAFVPQLVKMKRNSKGLLTELETARNLSTSPNGFETDSFAMNLSGAYEIYTSGKVPNVNYQYGYDANTTIFLLDTAATDSLQTTDETAIRAVSGSELSMHYTRRPNVKVYDADEAWVAGAIVMSRPSVGNTRLIWIESCGRIMDEFGEERLQVNAYWKNNKWIFRENKSGVFADSISFFHKNYNKAFADMNADEQEAFLKNDTTLRAGDALYVTFDANDEISYAELVASPMRELGKNGYGKLDLSKMDTATGLTRGQLVIKTDTRLGIVTKETGEYVAVSLSNAAPGVFILHTSTGKLTKADIGDLPTNGCWTEYGTTEITDADRAYFMCYNRGVLNEILMAEP